MKKTFTFLKSGAFSVGAWVAMTLMGLSPQSLLGQASTNPSPYCGITYANQAGPCTSNFGFRMARVQLANLDYWEPTCDASVTSNYRFFVPPAADRAILTPGNNYVVSITTGTGGGYNHGVGVWIDWNNNNAFEAGEFLTTGTNLATAFQGSVFTRNLSIPCGTAAGVYRIRTAMMYNQGFSAGQGCGAAPSGYGECWDFEIQVLPTPDLPKPDFAIPSSVFVGTPLVIRNTTAGLSGNFQWDLDLDGYDATTLNYPIVFTTSGTRFLKLRTTGCGVADSIIKPINVQNPTKAPATDFFANRTIVEEFEEVILTDISQDGPSNWSWEISDPFDAFGFFTQTNPDGTPLGLGNRYNRVRFMMQDMGLFDVCLTASNSQGNNKRCKRGYIDVVPYSEFRLGAGLSSTQLGKGTIYDKNGPNANYQTGANGDPTINRLRIQPCGAITITLNVVQFKLAQVSHNLKVWDGPNPAFGTPLHPPGGFTKENATQPFSVVAKSGAMYMELDTKTPGSVDSGMIAYFVSDFGVTGPPQPSIGLAGGATIAYTQAITEVRSTSKNIFGLPEYFWTVDGTPVSGAAYLGEGDAFLYTFPSAGTYNVCMEVTSCAGDAQFCDDIVVVNPTGPTDIDFVANNIRPDAFEPITVTSITDKANRFLWEIDPPGKFNFQAPFNATSKNLRGAFTEAGAYTITLTAWSTFDSSLTSATLSKQNYVVVVDYCTPGVQIVSGDVALRNIRLTNDKNQLIYSQTTSTGDVGYEAYLGTSASRIPMFVGGTYNLTLSRASNSDPVSHAVFVDFNGDGIFDASERVLRVMNTTNITTTGSFKVPDIENVFTGFPVRMRVVTSFRNNEPTACGPLSVGEFEDYLVNIIRISDLPFITLNGASTITIEAGQSFSDPGAVAMDNLEGDISNRLVVDTDLDNMTPGVYTITYNVRNASGRSAQTVTRTVIVTVDNTAPVLTLLGNNPDTIDVLSGPYVEPGYTAIDAVDGDLTAFVDVNSNVDVTKLGTYTISYSAIDQLNNQVTKTRTVVVVDRVAPVINVVGSEQVELGTFWFDQTSVSDNYWSTNDITFIKEYGFNGPVRWDVKGTYPVKYIAIDGSGNRSELTRTYVVNDFTAPVIRLNTSDTVIHDVTTPYASVNPTITDNQYPANSLQIEVTTDLNVNALGLYSEVFKATDGNGNTSTKTRWIRVVDRIAPVISAPAICSRVGVDFNSKATISVSDNFYPAATILDLVEVVSSNVNAYLVGSYTVTYQVTDPSGNRSQAVTQLVTISENCAVITSVNEVSMADLVKSYPNPTSGMFTVDLTQLTSSVKSVNVVNNLGQVVVAVPSAQFATGLFTIDMTAFASGVYSLHIKSDAGDAVVKVLMVK